MEWSLPTLLRQCLLSSVFAMLSIPRANAEQNAADFFVRSLPGAPDGPLLKMHAGYGLDLACCFRSACADTGY